MTPAIVSICAKIVNFCLGYVALSFFSIGYEVLQVVQLTKFDYRLASNLDEELQKLRCRVNYHALRFTKPIQEIGERLVTKMRKMAKRYIAVHLRFVTFTSKFN
jgi:hypothetical protein